MEVAELKPLRFLLGVTRIDKIRNEYIRVTAQVGRFREKTREAAPDGKIQKKKKENLTSDCTKVDFTDIKVDFTNFKVDFIDIKVDFSNFKVDFTNFKVDFTNFKVGKTKRKKSQSGTRKLPYIAVFRLVDNMLSNSLHC